MDTCIVYKLLTQEEYDALTILESFYGGNKMDLRDGYIHMSSTREQYERVQKKYYSGVDMILAVIDVGLLENVKWESMSNGDIYPHCYGSIPFAAIKEFVKLEPMVQIWPVN